MWPGERPLGRRFRLATAGAPWIEVVGVVGHIRQDGLDVDPRPQVYWNFRQRAMDRMVLVVRGASAVGGASAVRGASADGLTARVLAAVRAVDPEQPVYDVRTMNEVIDRSLSQRWLDTLLVSAFSAMSLLLSCVGVNGLISFGVARQAREFGVRLAVGATRAAIARQVLGRGLALALLGGALGLLLAALLTRALGGMLFEIAPTDPWSFGMSAAALLAAAALASYLPARRAAATEPVIALRAE
jgi:ABC-type antimicrobial peptide transport system permease subunit